MNGSFDVDITFTEPVTGFSPSGFDVVNGEVTGFGGSGASYRATIRPNAAGTVAGQGAPRCRHRPQRQAQRQHRAA